MKENQNSIKGRAKKRKAKENISNEAYCRDNRKISQAKEREEYRRNCTDINEEEI